MIRAPRLPLLPVEGLLRVGDIVEEELGVDRDLLVRAPLGGPASGRPWLALAFPVGGEQEPFEHLLPADFAERAARAGKLLPADAWSCWTEACS